MTQRGFHPEQLIRLGQVLPELIQRRVIDPLAVVANRQALREVFQSHGVILGGQVAN